MRTFLVLRFKIISKFSAKAFCIENKKRASFDKLRIITPLLILLKTIFYLFIF